MWNVTVSRSVDKQFPKLPERVRKQLLALMRAIRSGGPVRGDWPNYGKLSTDKHHCHLKKGQPTYVAVWQENKTAITVEVIYAGTHENAPY